jgi:5-methylcytosine-specific restriction endonuclease McrA
VVSVAESISAIEEARALREQPVETQAERTKRFMSSLQWRRMRVKILARDHCRCVACGASPDDGVTVLNVDHYEPISKNWERRLDPTNLFTTCGACNHGKLAGPPRYEIPARELEV